ncbi:DUF1798 family protein [Aquibacillus kalidii]|uniref:DUF1798 family protein n=1 Tax=Aquibacillus kalidii TaxID=2762597 RepID=UPI001647A26F|nr:DUF1798 family protein [Aquibacillus kalidii]
MNLADDTIQLKEIVEALKHRYLTNEKPENKKDRQFFEYVKGETAPIFEKIQKWEQDALTFVKKREVAVHPQQIESTKENLNLLLMHSYYIDARKRRYMELYQSVHYVFDAILDQIHMSK